MGKTKFQFVFSFSRWVMIYFPHRSDSVFSRTRSKIIIAFCWIVPVTFLLPSLFGLWGHHALECGPRHGKSFEIQMDLYMCVKWQVVHHHA